MLVYCSLCVCNLFIRAGNRGRWPASVKLVTIPYLTLPYTSYTSFLTGIGILLCINLYKYKSASLSCRQIVIALWCVQQHWLIMTNIIITTEMLIARAVSIRWRFHASPNAHCGLWARYWRTSKLPYTTEKFYPHFRNLLRKSHRILYSTSSFTDSECAQLVFCNFTSPGALAHERWDEIEYKKSEPMLMRRATASV